MSSNHQYTTSTATPSEDQSTDFQNNHNDITSSSIEHAHSSRQGFRQRTIDSISTHGGNLEYSNLESDCDEEQRLIISKKTASHRNAKEKFLAEALNISTKNLLYSFLILCFGGLLFLYTVSEKPVDVIVLPIYVCLRYSFTTCCSCSHGGGSSLEDFVEVIGGAPKFNRSSVKNCLVPFFVLLFVANNSDDMQSGMGMKRVVSGDAEHKLGKQPRISSLKNIGRKLVIVLEYFRDKEKGDPSRSLSVCDELMKEVQGLDPEELEKFTPKEIQEAVIEQIETSVINRFIQHTNAAHPIPTISTGSIADLEDLRHIDDPYRDCVFVLTSIDDELGFNEGMGSDEMEFEEYSPSDILYAPVFEVLKLLRTWTEQSLSALQTSDIFLHLFGIYNDMVRFDSDEYKFYVNIEHRMSAKKWADAGAQAIFVHNESYYRGKHANDAEFIAKKHLQTMELLASKLKTSRCKEYARFIFQDHTNVMKKLTSNMKTELTEQMTRVWMNYEMPQAEFGIITCGYVAHEGVRILNPGNDKSHFPIQLQETGFSSVFDKNQHTSTVGSSIATLLQHSKIKFDTLNLPVPPVAVPIAVLQPRLEEIARDLLLISMEKFDSISRLEYEELSKSAASPHTTEVDFQRDMMLDTVAPLDKEPDSRRTFQALNENLKMTFLEYKHTFTSQEVIRSFVTELSGILRTKFISNIAASNMLSSRQYFEAQGVKMRYPEINAVSLNFDSTPVSESDDSGNLILLKRSITDDKRRVFVFSTVDSNIAGDPFLDEGIDAGVFHAITRLLTSIKLDGNDSRNDHAYIAFGEAIRKLPWIVNVENARAADAWRRAGANVILLDKKNTDSITKCNGQYTEAIRLILEEYATKTLDGEFRLKFILHDAEKNLRSLFHDHVSQRTQTQMQEKFGYGTVEELLTTKIPEKLRPCVDLAVLPTHCGTVEGFSLPNSYLVKNLAKKHNAKYSDEFERKAAIRSFFSGSGLDLD